MAVAAAAILFSLGGWAINEIQRVIHKPPDIEEERKRHDLALEKFTKEHADWSERRADIFDFLQKQKLIKNIAQADFNLTDRSLELYKEYHPHPQYIETEMEEPKFTNYYTKSYDYKYIYAIGGGIVSMYLIKKVI